MTFELKRGPWFELSEGLWPSRGESWVDPAGVVLRVEQQRCETRAESIRDEARAEMIFELKRGRRAAGEERDEARAE
jgi:hypothetical protein